MAHSLRSLAQPQQWFVGIRIPPLCWGEGLGVFSWGTRCLHTATRCLLRAFSPLQPGRAGGTAQPHCIWERRCPFWTGLTNPKQLCFYNVTETEVIFHGICAELILTVFCTACDFLLCIFGYKFFIPGQYPRCWFICKTSYKWLNIR